jgi:hypothetical protein
MALYQCSLRWFEACSCKPTPKDLPSSSVQLRTLYIKSALVAHLELLHVSQSTVPSSILYSLRIKKRVDFDRQSVLKPEATMFQSVQSKFNYETASSPTSFEPLVSL